MIDYLVGCPAWDRAWSLDLWFQSLRSNLEPSKTGLIFVVPPMDESTRDAIDKNSGGFAWVEILRDKNAQYDREDRSEQDNHEALAMARNRLLAVAHKTRPRKFISWDSDLLLSPGALGRIESVASDLPLVGIWAWLNRQAPHRTKVETQDKQRSVLWEYPMQATAMKWEDLEKASHFEGKEWEMRATGLWRADVVLGFQMMTEHVYCTTYYAAHVDGEDIPFNWQLERRRIPRYICGDEIGVHLYTHNSKEISLGWPDIMDLKTQIPLAASRPEPRDPVDEALGFYDV